MVDADVTLDCTGLRCPLPIMKATKALKEMPAGQTLKVVSTDPGSRRDFEGMCAKTGNPLLQTSEDRGVYTYLIRKG